MADKGNSPCGAFDACWRTVGIRGWRPHRPLRLGSTPMTIDEPTKKITSASRRCPMRIKKPYTVEVVGDRTIVIARHADHTGGPPMVIQRHLWARVRAAAISQNSRHHPLHGPHRGIHGNAVCADGIEGVLRSVSSSVGRIYELQRGAAGSRRRWGGQQQLRSRKELFRPSPVPEIHPSALRMYTVHRRKPMRLCVAGRISCEM